MKHIHFLILLLAIAGLVAGCSKKESKFEMLQGEWVEYDKKRASLKAVEQWGYSRFEFRKLEAFRIYPDSIEFYNGIYKLAEKPIRNTSYRPQIYCGNFTALHFSGDSLYTVDCATQSWKLFGVVKKLTPDSLVLSNPGYDDRLFLRPAPPSKAPPEFDQLVFSYAAFATHYQISIEKNGQVFVSGIIPTRDEEQRYAFTVLQARLSPKETAIIFSGFAQAEPLKKEYGFAALDGSKTVTTFIKDHKIIKTVTDINESAPDRLFWAYVPIQNLLTTVNFNPLPAHKPGRFYFLDVAYRKNDKLLALNGAEKHYLWTELYKSPDVSTDFQPEYRLSSVWGMFSEPVFNKKTNRLEAGDLDSVLTDGRFYRFFSKNVTPFTKDLKYNFIERNLPYAAFKYEPEY